MGLNPLLMLPLMLTTDTMVVDTVDTTDTPTDTGNAKPKLKLNPSPKLPLMLTTDTTAMPVPMVTTDTPTLTDTVDTTADTTIKASSNSRFETSTPSFHQDQPKS